MKRGEIEAGHEEEMFYNKGGSLQGGWMVTNVKNNILSVSLPNSHLQEQITISLLSCMAQSDLTLAKNVTRQIKRIRKGKRKVHRSPQKLELQQVRPP